MLTVNDRASACWARDDIKNHIAIGAWDWAWDLHMFEEDTVRYPALCSYLRTVWDTCVFVAGGAGTVVPTHHDLVSRGAFAAIAHEMARAGAPASVLKAVRIREWYLVDANAEMLKAARGACKTCLTILRAATDHIDVPAVTIERPKTTPPGLRILVEQLKRDARPAALALVPGFTDELFKCMTGAKSPAHQYELEQRVKDAHRLLRTPATDGVDPPSTTSMPAATPAAVLPTSQTASIMPAPRTTPSAAPPTSLAASRSTAASTVPASTTASDTAAHTTPSAAPPTSRAASRLTAASSASTSRAKAKDGVPGTEPELDAARDADPDPDADSAPDGRDPLLLLWDRAGPSTTATFRPPPLGASIRDLLTVVENALNEDFPEAAQQGGRPVGEEAFLHESIQNLIDGLVEAASLKSGRDAAVFRKRIAENNKVIEGRLVPRAYNTFQRFLANRDPGTQDAYSCRSH